ncbi:hypothetical protein B5G34_14015 [Flavonifractor sp. An82]|uniref:RCC1 domain-containing protein n=1 Tax=Flavonifractor sp. An82 TaxID=1965660 RepID=UPI000B3A9A26|nr:S-layer homology domain-containing protein [Flavonifractor sp. An82]OUN20637.1 hypothetical protein B5G34_14015 [Flavonifractor sp. An82]
MKKFLSFALALMLCMALTPPAAANDTLTAGEYSTVSCSWRFTAAIDTEGVLWTWGSNEYGMLGTGSEIANTATPVRVMDNVVSVVCGYEHVAAIRSDGSLWVWGNNRFGQLGNDGAGNAGKAPANYQTVPVKIMEDVAMVDCGLSYTAALKTDGSLWTWGNISGGVLGNGFTWNDNRGSAACQTVPVKIMEDVALIRCGSTHMAAIKTDGSLWTWGKNDSGQLGNGGIYNQEIKQPYPLPPSKQQTLPVKIMDRVADVWCMDDFMVIQRLDGTIWCCGQEYDSPFNDILREGTNVPVKTTMRNIASFGNLSYLTEDGTLWMWGFPVGQTTPVKVLDHVAGVSYSTNGHGHYMAVRDDNTLWGWGYNEEGQLALTQVQAWQEQRTPVKVRDGIAVSGAAPTPSVPTVAGFSDVYETDYYADAVSWAKEKGVTGGTSATTFSPDHTVTRAEAVTFLWRAAGSPQPASAVSPFADVTDSGAYYYSAVLWAAEQGITGGVGNGQFGLSAALSYDQILTMLQRAAGEATSGGDWSAAAVSWAAENGLTNGLDFTAKDSCPRSDVVYCLWKQLA